MSEHSVEEINRHVKIYKGVLWALLVLTVVTVLAAYHKVSIVLGVVIALIIALVKGGLVASFFMHLAYEKKLIFAILALTVVFFAVMMTIILSYHYYGVHYEF